MKKIKLYDSELRIMNSLWEKGPTTASKIALALGRSDGLSRNAVYTVIGKLVDKGAIDRLEPNYTCIAKVTREEVQQIEAVDFVEKLFGGSPTTFLSAYCSEKTLDSKEIKQLKDLIRKMDSDDE